MRGRATERLLAPRDQPLSIRRRAFRSLDRLAPRDLAAAAPAAGAGAAAGPRGAPEAPATRRRRLTARARLRRAVFTRPDPGDRGLGRGELRRDPGRGRPELPRPHPDRRVRRSCCCGCRSRSGRWPPVPPCSARRLLRAARPPSPPRRDAGPPPRVALIVPIYNEDTERVFAGLRAMWEDLRAQPQGERVDLFILSDTTDPDIWLAELDAWQRLRQSRARGRADLLPAPPAQPEAQDRQHRGLRHPLGRRLRLHDRARRRQPDVGPRHDAAWSSAWTPTRPWA